MVEEVEDTDTDDDESEYSNDNFNQLVNEHNAKDLEEIGNKKCNCGFVFMFGWDRGKFRHGSQKNKKHCHIEIGLQH